MLRWTKWVAPMAALVLMAGFQSVRAQDAAVKPAGKATVTVTVVDTDGKPVAGATVSISAAQAGKHNKGATTQPDPTAPKPPKPVAIETGTSAADGTYALTQIPDGNFVVQAKLKGVGQGHAKVVVEDDKDQTVSVTLTPKKAN